MNARQEQNGLLDVEGQMHEVRDLGQSRPTHVPQSGPIRRVDHDAVADQEDKEGNEDLFDLRGW